MQYVTWLTNLDIAEELLAYARQIKIVIENLPPLPDDIEIVGIRVDSQGKTEMELDINLQSKSFGIRKEDETGILCEYRIKGEG